MLLLAVFVCAIGVALLRGGDLGALGRHRWRGPVLPIAAIVIQVLAFLPDERASSTTRIFVASLHVASYLLLGLFVWWNHRTPWLWVVGCGLLANALVILANGGYMPVDPQAAAGTPQDISDVGLANNAVLMTGQVRLAFLADVIRSPHWLPFGRAFSPGDVLLAVGMFGLIQRLLRSPAAPPGDPA